MYAHSTCGSECTTHANNGGIADQDLGMRLMRTKGRRRAVVAAARKLAVLLHRMWIDGTEFRQDQVGSTT